MALKVKLSFVLLIILFCVSLALAGTAFYLLKQEQLKNTNLQGELSGVISKQRAAENRANDYQKNISVLEQRLQDASAQVESLVSDLEKEKSANLAALDELAQLKQDVEQQKSIRADLEEKLTKAQDDMKRLQAQAKELDNKRIELEAKIKDAEAKVKLAAPENVELGKIVVAPETAAAEPAVKNVAAKPGPSEGKILVINKEYNFVVISLGNKDGIAVGEVFSVYHNNKDVGDVKVEKVHDSMSAAGFVSADMKNKVSEGDRVVPKAQ